MSYLQYEPGSSPAKGEVWKDSANRHWAFVSMFKHDPKTCAPRDYVILQIYGNYGNEVQIVELDAFPHLFTFAWGPMMECKFCGFRRMAPCATRQPCPNLRDYRLEDDIALSREEPADA